MKRTLGIVLALLLITSSPLWASHKKSSKEGGPSKGHSHSKSSKSKKTKGSKKGGSGAEMESQIKTGDVQFDAKSTLK